MSHRISYDRAKEMIGNRVCPGCGGELVPIETVDNSDNPTYWAGCNTCSEFSWGVDPTHHQIAKVLVLSKGYVHYSHLGTPYHLEGAELLYWQRKNIQGAAGLIGEIFRIKNQILNT